MPPRKKTAGPVEVPAAKYPPSGPVRFLKPCEGNLFINVFQQSREAVLQQGRPQPASDAEQLSKRSAHKGKLKTNPEIEVEKADDV